MNNLQRLHEREVQDRRRTTLHVIAFGIAVLVVVASLIVATQWIAMTIR